MRQDRLGLRPWHGTSVQKSGATPLVRQEEHADTYKDSGEPSAAVDVLVQEKLCRERVADKCQRCGRWCGQGDIHAGKREKEGKKRDRHRQDAEQKQGTGDDGTDRAKEAALCANRIQVTEPTHRRGGQHIAANSGRGDRQDRRPCDEGTGRRWLRGDQSRPPWVCSGERSMPVGARRRLKSRSCPRHRAPHVRSARVRSQQIQRHRRSGGFPTSAKR